MCIASSFRPRDNRNFGLSGNMNNKHPTTNDGKEQISKNILHELYRNNGDLYPMSVGIISQANPATNKFPSVQNAAINDNIEPRFDFGWNSAKYDQITGPLPPNLKHKVEKYI